MDHQTTTEEQNVNVTSVEEAIKLYQTPLINYAARLLNCYDTAQDIIQESFIRLNDQWDRLKERGVNVKGWLYRTAHNAAVDHIRKESRLALLHQKHSQEQKTKELISENKTLTHEERQKIVLQYFNKLKPKEREVLILRMQEGLSYKEIATVLNRTTGYVGKLVHTASKTLSQSLRQAGVVS